MRISEILNFLIKILASLFELENVVEKMPNAGTVTCNTLDCFKAAQSIQENMDLNVNPCDNFYKFACGGLLKTAVIPDDKPGIDTLSMIADVLQDQLMTSMEEKSSPNEPKPFKLVKTLYKSCMNETTIEKQGLEPLRKILKDLGGWPVLMGDKWNETGFNWKDSIYNFRKMGYSVDLFITISVNSDSMNNTKNVIELDQALLSLPNEYLIEGLDNEIVKSYYNYMIDVAEILGANRNQAAAELKQSLEFEMKLANISLPREQRRDATALYNPMTITELRQKFSTIPWMEYLNTLLAPSAMVTEGEIVVINVPSFISSLERLLEQTPRRVQANYMIWRIVAQSVITLTDEVRKKTLTFATAFIGRTKNEPRWKECVAMVSQNLPLSIGALYVKKHFDEDAKQIAAEMMSDIRAEFMKILKAVDWLDEVTRKAALDKAEAMSTHVAYPDELLDNKKLEEYYGKLEISEGNYLQSMLNLTLFMKEITFGRLHEPVNKSDWTRHGGSAEINAYYLPTENSIEFTAAILQGACFNKNLPRYMNYGAVGLIIGHEITHGFDDQGSQYDKDGNLVEWWREETKKKFLQKAQCIVHQYGNYIAAEVSLNLNGINTQSENIADNGGTKEAYLAYNEWEKRNGPEPLLPGLEYSPRQMFWISAANNLCSKDRSEMLALTIKTDSHSPSEFRVNGPLSNSPEFAKDFKCPIGAKMNPEKKCAVW